MSAEAERWREAAYYSGSLDPIIEAGDAVVKALEAERERVRRMGEDHAEYRRNATAAVEARDRRVAELEEGVWAILNEVGTSTLAAKIARDLMVCRMPGGEA